MYHEDDLLMLSGIQHIAFCKRQWALIHVEKQWQENVLTIEGQILHKKVDNPLLKEKRKGLIIARAVPIVSYKLGLNGIADVIEFITTDELDNSVKLPRKKGLWCPKVVEYKKGKPKKNNCDAVQLCAQNICIEEMYGIEINSSEIFYAKTKHRLEVLFDKKLRKQVEELAKEMHRLLKLGKTPKAEKKPHCNNCSLKEICMPTLSQLNASKYLKENL